jgi:hypothetical protein
MKIRDIDLQITSEPAIAYSTCYRLPFLSLYKIDVLEGLKNILLPATYAEILNAQMNVVKVLTLKY